MWTIFLKAFQTDAVLTEFEAIKCCGLEKFEFTVGVFCYWAALGGNLQRDGGDTYPFIQFI